MERSQLGTQGRIRITTKSQGGDMHIKTNMYKTMSFKDISVYKEP